MSTKHGGARLRSPLGQAYGLGSAREGAQAWWSLRVSAVALIPLTLWWVFETVAHAGLGYGSFVAWVHEPITAILLILTISATLLHTAQGLQEVLEDYVHVEWAKIAGLIVVRFGCIALAVAGLYSILRIAFGG